MNAPSPADAKAAQGLLFGKVRRTPVLTSEALSRLVGTTVHVKAEALQVTGAFKVRGALNRIATLPAEAREAGLLTVSAGNAALGAAYAARLMNARLTVVMPENAVPEKLAAVRGYGGEVVVDGVVDGVTAFARAAQLQQDRGLTLVHPFDDPMVVAGASTVTMELLEDAPDITRLYVPCSGGGLLAGAILAARAMDHPVTIVGVQPAGADGIVRSLAAGRPTTPPVIHTVADGLAAPQPGELNLAMIRDAGVAVLTVTDDHIIAALRTLVTELRILLEPSAAASWAGALADPARGSGPIGIVLSGSNVRRELLVDCLRDPS